MKRETWGRRFGRGLVLLLPLLALLSGCASFDGLAPRSSGSLPAGGPALGRSLEGVKADGDWPAQEWWRAFGDSQLDALVAEALAANPDMRLARSRVDGARAAVSAADSALLPGMGANFDASRQRFSEFDLIPPPWGGSFQTAGHLSLDFNHEFDFWGRNRALLAAALSRARAAELEGEAARLVLTVAVCRAYVELDRLETRHELLAALAALKGEADRLTARRVQAGLAPESDGRQAAAAAATARVRLAALEQARAAARHRLGILAGAGPDRGLALLRPTLRPAPGTLALPGALPAELIARRPEIQARREEVAASLGDAQAARAAFYPDVNLAAFAGVQSLGPGHLFDAGSRIAGVAPAVHLPLFSGRLRAGLAGANAGVDLAVARYDQAVLAAVQDVADRVSDWRWLERQAGEQGRVQAETEAAWRLARRREGAGLATRLAVIGAEARLREEGLVVAELAARRLVSAIELDHALGGGFAAVSRRRGVSHD